MLTQWGVETINYKSGIGPGTIVWSGPQPMMTLPELASEALADFLGTCMRRLPTSTAVLIDIVPYAARIAMECIGNSDALYHNAEHTLLVTLAGYDIMRGRALHAQVTASDYAHVIVACLTHDIGYVRGALEGDEDHSFVIDAAGNKVNLPRGSSDASLMPYHVDRSSFTSCNGSRMIPPSTSSE